VQKFLPPNFLLDPILEDPRLELAVLWTRFLKCAWCEKLVATLFNINAKEFLGLMHVEDKLATMIPRVPRMKLPIMLHCFSITVG
jgi:hypothetical protein